MAFDYDLDFVNINFREQPGALSGWTWRGNFSRWDKRVRVAMPTTKAARSTMRMVK